MVRLAEVGDHSAGGVEDLDQAVGAVVPDDREAVDVGLSEVLRVVVGVDKPWGASTRPLVHYVDAHSVRVPTRFTDQARLDELENRSSTTHDGSRSDLSCRRTSCGRILSARG